MAAEYVLGIDLGTTFTAAAVVRDGRATVCTLGTRAQSIPTVVAVQPDGAVLVGEAAERRASVEPTQVAREFKRRLGDTTPLVLGSVSYTPQALMALVLKWVVREVTVSEDGPPVQVVLTHPAHFGPYKRDLMGEVIRLADIANARLITEPEAAAISYAQKSVIEPGRTVAVYDLGGGTFDAALVRRTVGGGFELVGSADGIERLGGIDFDQLLLEMVMEQAELGNEDLAGARPAEIAALRQRCRDAKEALSTDPAVEIAPGIGQTDSVAVRRTEFERAIRPRILESVESLQRVIRSSGLSSGDIDRVLLVGGSSRIPLVADIVRTTLGLPVAVDANPKFAICTGAALSAVPAASAAAVEPSARPASDVPDAPTAVLPVVPPSRADVTRPMPATGDPADAAATPTPAGASFSATSSPPVNNARRNGLIAAGVVALLGIVGGAIALSGGDEKTTGAGRTTTPAAPLSGVTQPEVINPPPLTVPVGQVTLPGVTTPVAPSVAPTTPPTPSTPAPTTPVTQPAPVTTPATTPVTTPVGTADLNTKIDATVWIRGIALKLSKLEFVRAENRLTFTATATTTQRRDTAVPTPEELLLHVGDQTIGMDYDSPGALSGEGVSTRANISTTSLPQAFDISTARLTVGRPGDHQAVVTFAADGTPTVVQSQAPIPLQISGAATSNLGVTFTATGGEIASWACGDGSDNLTFHQTRGDEYSIIIHGDLVMTEGQTGGTSLTDAAHGFTRLKLPDGTVREASATIDRVLNQGDRVRDARICFSSLTLPIEGTYELQLLAGAFGADKVGTLSFDIPGGLVTGEPATDQTAAAEPFVASAWSNGLRYDFSQYAFDADRVWLTVDIFNSARIGMGRAAAPMFVRYDGSDYSVNWAIEKQALGAGTTARATLASDPLPATFDRAQAQFIIGKVGDHQAIIDLGTANVIQAQVPAEFPASGTANTNAGVSFTATKVSVVPWSCTNESSRIGFDNLPADEYSIIIEGQLEPKGPFPAGGVNLNDSSHGFTRLVTPTNETYEANTTVDFTEGVTVPNGLICFSSLLAPVEGTYTLQIRAGGDEVPGAGQLQVTIPPGTTKTTG